MIEASNMAEEEESALAWQNFLTAYARGDFGPETCPAMPPIPPGLLRPYNPDAVPVPWAFADAPLYSSSSTISLADARAIRKYYCENHYLPPPRSPFEDLRHDTINAYNVYGPKQLSNIQAASDIIAAFFPGTVCTFSLFHDHIQKHFCISGNEELIKHYQLVPGLRIPSEDSLCGHAVLHENSLFYVSALKKDWRYLNNPFVFAGFKSFIGSSVSLQVNPLAEQGSRIVVGTLNVCFIDESLDVLGASQRKVVRQVTSMLETQLRSTWEGDQRTKEGRARLALADLIQDALVDIKLNDGAVNIAAGALERLCHVLPDVDNVVLLNTGAVELNGKFFPGIGTPLEVIASAGKPYRPIPQQLLLDCINSSSKTVYQSGVNPQSKFEPYLDSSVRSHLVLPLRSTDRPFYVILATSKSYYAFPNSDINIIRSLGSVLRARAVQYGVMQADAAKTSFLSSISHELRTPMHGVKASLELIRKSADAKDWDEVEGPLGLAEASGRALLNILNDVLDFGKNDWEKVDDKEEIDLARSAREIASVCLAHHGDLLGEAASVKFECEERDWRVELNEAKFHRIIMNGLTNAIKFTHNGEIILSLRTTPDGQRCVVQISDNGIGIDADALPRLMQPFTKMDNDSPGAGLGLYITKALVEKMGGELVLTSVKGRGTEFTATLPVALAPQTGTTSIKSSYLPTNWLAPPSSRTSTTTNPPPSNPPDSPQIHLSNDDPLHPLRVLIMDDNDLCRKILRMAFKRAPMSITCMEAENGQVGVELFEEFEPDVVLTDVSMPILDGVAAAGKMREMLAKKPRACRIYALTGLGSSDPRTQSIGVHGKAALDGWLVKGKDMLDAVYKILGEVKEGKTMNGVKEV